MGQAQLRDLKTGDGTLVERRAQWKQDDGEIVISGRRHLAVDVRSLCRHIDLLVGCRVAEVIFNQHWFALGRDDAVRAKVEKPSSNIREIVTDLAQYDRLSGLGVTRLTIPENPDSPVELEISNPCLDSSEGAGKAVLTSYWCGALTFLLGKEVVVSNLTFDQNIARCKLEAKLPQHLLEA
jgi:hypothetical protein